MGTKVKKPKVEKTPDGSNIKQEGLGWFRLLVVALSFLAALLNTINAIIALYREGSALPAVLLSLLVVAAVLAVLFFVLRKLIQRVVLLILVLVLLAFGIWAMIRVILPPPPLVYDFERGIGDWGEHPAGKRLVTGLGVHWSNQHHGGKHALEFKPTETNGQDAYVAVLRDPARSTSIPRMVTAYVFVPRGANVSAGASASTAKIILWDKSWRNDESDFAELQPGMWQKVSWQPSSQGREEPWREIGFHLYLLNHYPGPIYIDEVTVYERRTFGR